MFVITCFISFWCDSVIKVEESSDSDEQYQNFETCLKQIHGILVVNQGAWDPINLHKWKSELSINYFLYLYVR